MLLNHVDDEYRYVKSRTKLYCFVTDARIIDV